MPRPIYAVASGTYEDHQIHALFDERADAEAHTAARNASKDNYEESEVETLTAYGPGEAPAPVSVWTVQKSLSTRMTVREETKWDYSATEPVMYEGGPQMWRAEAPGRCYAMGTDPEACKANVEAKIVEARALSQAAKF